MTARFAQLFPAQLMIADLCFVFQKCNGLQKRATKEVQDASAALTCSAALFGPICKLNSDLLSEHMFVRRYELKY